MEQTRERHEGTVIAEQPILDFLIQKGVNPEDYRLSNAFIFEQVEENGEYEHTGLELHVMKKEHTHEAFIAYYDYHHRELHLSNEDGHHLDSGIGLRYHKENGYQPCFFEVVELYKALGEELPEHF